ADGSIVPRSVKAGISDGESTEILAGGLSEGDLVVTGEAGELAAESSEEAASPVAPEPEIVFGASEEGTTMLGTTELSFVRTAEVETFLRFYSRGGGRGTAERAVD